jgi:hypothetical protein
MAGRAPHTVDKFVEHLTGGTPVTYLADLLREAGTPVGKTTLKDYRKALR